MSGEPQNTPIVGGKGGRILPFQIKKLLAFLFCSKFASYSNPQMGNFLRPDMRISGQSAFADWPPGLRLARPAFVNILICCINSVVAKVSFLHLFLE